MDGLQRLEYAVTLCIALSASAALARAQTETTQEQPPTQRAESFMVTVGSLKAPLLIAMNCPDAEQNERTYIAQLSRNNTDLESVTALVHGSIAIVQKIELTVDRGETNQRETAESFQTSARRLMRLAASVQSSGGLDFDGVKFGYRTDSLVYQILSSISVLYAQRIPAYTRTIDSDPTAANTLKATIVEARLNELTQGHPGAANDKLKRLVAEEIRIGRLEWIATRNLIALGLDHVILGDGTPANFTQRTLANARPNELEAMLSGKSKDDYAPGYTPGSQFPGSETSHELQEFEKTQTELASVLAQENKLVAALQR